MRKRQSSVTIDTQLPVRSMGACARGVGACAASEIASVPTAVTLRISFRIVFPGARLKPSRYSQAFALLLSGGRRRFGRRGFCRLGGLRQILVNRLDEHV